MPLEELRLSGPPGLEEGPAAAGCGDGVAVHLCRLAGRLQQHCRLRRLALRGVGLTAGAVMHLAMASTLRHRLQVRAQGTTAPLALGC